MTPIILSDEDATKFVAFQKHYELFSIMEKAGVFNIQYGKMIINFAGGVAQNCVKEEMVWKR
jgi:hypothetical protein